MAFDGRLFVLGSAEIRVLGKELVFAAPNLVHHYVAVHHYRPPDVFVEAALSGPRPPSAEYFRRLDALGCHWERARASSVQVDWERWARGAKTEAADRRSGAAERVQHLTASWSQHLSHERDFDGFVGEVIRLVSNGDKVSMLLGSGPEIHLHVGTRPATLTDADAEAKLRAVCERLASLFLGGGRTPPALGKLSGGVELRGARCRALLTYVTATRGAKTQFALYPAIDPSSQACVPRKPETATLQYAASASSNPGTGAEVANGSAAASQPTFLARPRSGASSSCS